LWWWLVGGRRESGSTRSVLLDQVTHCTERIAMQAVEQAPWRFSFLQPPPVLAILLQRHLTDLR